MTNDKKQKNVKLFSGPITQMGDKPDESIKVGTISLFSVNSDNPKAPQMSGEIRIKDRIYRVALWKPKDE